MAEAATGAVIGLTLEQVQEDAASGGSRLMYRQIHQEAPKQRLQAVTSRPSSSGTTFRSKESKMIHTHSNKDTIQFPSDRDGNPRNHRTSVQITHDHECVYTRHTHFQPELETEIKKEVQEVIDLLQFPGISPNAGEAVNRAISRAIIRGQYRVNPPERAPEEIQEAEQYFQSLAEQPAPDRIR